MLISFVQLMLILPPPPQPPQPPQPSPPLTSSSPDVGHTRWVPRHLLPPLYQPASAWWGADHFETEDPWDYLHGHHRHHLFHHHLFNRHHHIFPSPSPSFPPPSPSPYFPPPSSPPPLPNHPWLRLSPPPSLSPSPKTFAKR